MESVVTALTEIINSAPALETRRTCRVDTNDAPACIQQLVEAMCTHQLNVALHEYRLSVNENVALVTLRDTFEILEDLECDLEEALSQAGADHGPLDPDATLALGPDGGGMSILGVSWSGGLLSFVVIELEEDPNIDGLVRHYTTPGALFEYVENYLEGPHHQREHLALLKAAAIEAGASMEYAPPVTSIAPS